MKTISLALLLLLTGLVAGCGSGGAGGNTVTPSPQPGQSTTATIELSTRSNASDTVLYALQTTLLLPAGVSVSADPATGEIAAGVLQVRNSGTLAAARFIPATATAKARVSISLVNASGFPVGAFGTLTCQVAAGATVDAAGFSQEAFSARDVNGVAVPSISGQFAPVSQ